MSTTTTWIQTRMSRVATVNARIGWKALTAEEYQDDGFAFLATPNIKPERIDFNNVNYISLYRYEESPELKLALGDVLLAKDGMTLGITNIVSYLPRPATVNGSIAVLRPFNIEPRFLRYSLASTVSQDNMNAFKDGMDVPHLFQRDINRLPLSTPSFEEQRRIADFLDQKIRRIDELVDIRHRVQRGLTERRESSIYGAVTGVARGPSTPSELVWVTSLPQSWRVVRLGSVARMGSGHTPSRQHPEWWIDCTVPWITTGEVFQVRDDRQEIITETREKISEIGISNSSALIHPKGTVALCRTASAGYSAVMGADMATSQDFVTWTCGPTLNPFYLLWCLRAMRTDLLGRLAMGSTHKTIYVPDLQMLRIPLPPLVEQLAIVQRIRADNAATDAVIDSIDRQLALLAERRQALITAAVTGQIDVTTARGATP